MSAHNYEWWHLLIYVFVVTIDKQGYVVTIKINKEAV